MNKIVKEHYPAWRLPDDLRIGIDPAQNVKVIVEEEADTRRRRRSVQEIFEDAKPFQTRSAEEIDRFIREERDAWDD